MDAKYRRRGQAARPMALLLACVIMTCVCGCWTISVVRVMTRVFVCVVLLCAGFIIVVVIIVRQGGADQLARIPTAESHRLQHGEQS